MNFYIVFCDRVTLKRVSKCISLKVLHLNDSLWIRLKSDLHKM